MSEFDPATCLLRREVKSCGQTGLGGVGCDWTGGHCQPASVCKTRQSLEQTFRLEDENDQAE